MRNPGDSPARDTGDTGDPGGADGLVFQCCVWCGTTMFRRLLCPVCRSTDLTPTRSEGEGTVLARRAVPPGAEDLWPVRMAEGFVVRCKVEGPPHAIRPGVHVRLSARSRESSGTGVRAAHRVPVVPMCDVVPLDGWN